MRFGPPTNSGVTVTCQSAEQTARTIVERVGSEVVLGLPIGIGKTTHVADALFELATRESSISLTIFTGLTLEPPQGQSELEKRFLEPLVERLYTDWPVPRYAKCCSNSSISAYSRRSSAESTTGLFENYSTIAPSQKCHFTVDR